MTDLDPIAVGVATLALFIIRSAYYAVLPKRWVAASPAAAAGEQPPPWKLAVELVRCLVLATVVAGLASRGGIDEIAGGLVLGLALWVGFPAVLWAGAIVWENTPGQLAALHGGDWLVKLLAAGAILSAWQ